MVASASHLEFRFDRATIDSMFRAPVIAHERLVKLTSLLDQAEIPYAVIGGHAVAYWVATEEPAAVRTTPNPNVLLRRIDFPRAIEVCHQGGLTTKEERERGRTYIRFDDDHRYESAGWFLMANERYRETDLFSTPDVCESIRGDEYQVVDLLPLVIMKLTAYPTIDRVHLRDLLNVDAINADWLERVPPELKGRLDEVLDDPFG